MEMREKKSINKEKKYKEKNMEKKQH